jgi:hypothetical protein
MKTSKHQRFTGPFLALRAAEDKGQNLCKLLKERFPMKYTIISTVLILKPSVSCIMYKAK